MFLLSPEVDKFLTLELLGASTPCIILAINCGRASLQVLVWTSFWLLSDSRKLYSNCETGRLYVQVNGFVTNMSDWMAACDCVITKVVLLLQSFTLLAWALFMDMVCCVVRSCLGLLT